MSGINSLSGLQLPGLKLEPGSRTKSRLSILEYIDGATLEVPVLVVQGSKPGPTFYLGSAFHGDEVNGVHVVSRLAHELDPRELSGTVIVVPAQNPAALRVQHRYSLGHITRSPMDQSPSDPWACFPGDEHGTMASRLLRSIGMLSGDVEDAGRKLVMSGMTIIRATRGGLLNREVSLNEEVKKGQLLATISNLFGETMEEIRAPHDGPVVRTTTFPAIESGERVIQLAVPR